MKNVILNYRQCQNDSCNCAEGWSSVLTWSLEWWDLFVIREEILGPAFPAGD